MATARRPQRTALPLLALMLTVALGPPGALAGEEPAPVQLKWKRTGIGRANQSAVAVDFQGNTHVVFNSQKKNGDPVLTHTWFEGKQRRSETIATGAGYGNAIAIDAQGGVHVCFAVQTPGNWQLVYGQRGEDGWEFEDVDTGAQSISMAVDDAGVVHVLHIKGNVGSSVRYARRTPTGWETEEAYPAGLWFSESALLVRDGVVYATFTGEDFPRPLILATRSAVGDWTSEVLDDGANGNCEHSSATFDGAGNLHVAYVNGGVTHAWQTQAGWQREVLTTTTEFFGVSWPDGISTNAEDVSLATGPQGQLLLVSGLYLSKGNAYAQALWTAILDDGVWFPDLIKVGRVGYRTWLAMGPDGLAHVTTTQGKKIVLFRLRGQKLRLGVRAPESGTISVAPLDVECDRLCKLEVFPGARLTLTATPAAGFDFDEWRRACQGSDPVCELTMDRNKRVLARFSEALP